jgi:nucleotide-binding universal stress UspA family protein
MSARNRLFRLVPSLRRHIVELAMMPPPRHRRFRLILAAVDLSPQSAHALRYAMAMAHACGGRVIAVHALDPLLEAAAAQAYADKPLVSDTKQALVRFARKTLGPDAARVEFAVVIGPPRQAIMAEAARRRPDVVVVGTNARGGMSKLFFGSTTEALLRRYRGAVLVVPPRSGDPGSNWPHGDVVAAIAAGPHRRAMVSAAARTAEIFGGWLSMTSPEGRLPRSRWHGVPIVVLPLPDSARLKTFTQGTRAYEFVRRARAPVLVMHTGRRIGHVEPRHTAA